MALRRVQLIRALHRHLHHVSQFRESSYLLGSYSHYSTGVSNGLKCSFNFKRLSSFLYNGPAFPWTSGKTLTLRSTMAAEMSIFMNERRFSSGNLEAKAAPIGQKMGSVKLTILSPGIVYDPYVPREPISFWQRWFTRSGWRRTKDDMVLEMKTAYAIAKLRKAGHKKKQFYNEAVNMYKEINMLVAHGDKKSLRKAVTEKMFSELKNEIKQRETVWSKVYWELIEPVVKIRTLRARLIGIDKDDTNKVFIQLTLEFLAKQKFEAYDSKGAVVAGDKNKEILVRDIWVFEKSMFHRNSYWRLCGKISV